jgi:hypothetical protein
MIRTLFLVPRSAQRRPALVCVWTATGNPRQPLARIWLDTGASAVAEADRCPQSVRDGDPAVPLYQLCA